MTQSNRTEIWPKVWELHLQSLVGDVEDRDEEFSDISFPFGGSDDSTSPYQYTRPRSIYERFDGQR